MTEDMKVSIIFATEDRGVRTGGLLQFLLSIVTLFLGHKVF